jgi:Asp-tRNA(Asn)/Glu-tRNA(Gln) amidotransferase B subunit
VNELSKDEKWAEELSSQCGISSAFLKRAMEEMSESCYADTKTSKDIIEELTLSCHMDKEELQKFVDEVSKNCPIDAKKLRDEVFKAEGDKNKVWQGAREWAQYRGGAR